MLRAKHFLKRACKAILEADRSKASSNWHRERLTLRLSCAKIMRARRSLPLTTEKRPLATRKPSIIASNNERHLFFCVTYDAALACLFILHAYEQPPMTPPSM